jgi:hypothetical protein
MMKKLLGIMVLGLLFSGCASDPRNFPRSNEGAGNIIKENKNFIILAITVIHSPWSGSYQPEEDLIKNQIIASNHCASYGKFAFDVDNNLKHYRGYRNGFKYRCEKKPEDIVITYEEMENKRWMTGEINWTNFDTNSDLHIKNVAAENKINKENQIKYKAKKLADNKNRCEEIGFTPQTESFAKCVLKLIELAEIRESALIESRSRASLEADMQQQQIDIQDQIAAEAKASRDQQAWGVLLGMTMGSGILDTSSGGLFSPSTVSCNKTGETTSGTNKICYYNCMGSTKTINVGSMQFCPININK